MRTPHFPLDILYSFFLTFLEAQHLLVTSAAGVAAASAVGMAVRAGVRTVVLTAFFNGFTEGDNAQARRTGTFHLGYGSHFMLSWWVVMFISEHIFIYMSRGRSLLLELQERSPSERLTIGQAPTTK
jgi:hypothetical protein